MSEKEALKYLSENNYKVAKSLILEIVEGETGPVAEFALDQLKIYHNDMDVRQVLWEILGNKKHIQKIRLIAAKGLVENEPVKVMNTLFELNQW